MCLEGSWVVTLSLNIPPCSWTFSTSWSFHAATNGIRGTVHHPYISTCFCGKHFYSPMVIYSRLQLVMKCHCKWRHARRLQPCMPENCHRCNYLRRSVMHKGMQPAGICVVLWWNNSHTLQRPWATATGKEEEELEEKDKMRKTSWTFSTRWRMLTWKNGLLYFLLASSIHRFINPVERQHCFSIVLWYTNKHHHPYIDSTTVLSDTRDHIRQPLLTQSQMSNRPQGISIKKQTCVVLFAGCTY